MNVKQWSEVHQEVVIQDLDNREVIIHLERGVDGSDFEIVWLRMIRKPLCVGTSGFVVDPGASVALKIDESTWIDLKSFLGGF